MANNNRETISVNDCQVLALYKYDGEQYILTLSSSEIAQTTIPGQFVHVTVSDVIAMRRPISVMSVDKENNTFDLLYKIVGEGTRQLAECKIGDMLSVIGPIGNGFRVTNKKNPLLIGGGVGMPPIIAIAQQIKNNNDYNPFVILGSEIPFPFTPQNSEISNSCPSKTYTMPILEDWNVACGLASLQGFKGVYKGYVCLLYTSPSPRDLSTSRMPSSA